MTLSDGPAAESADSTRSGVDALALLPSFTARTARAPFVYATATT